MSGLLNKECNNNVNDIIGNTMIPGYNTELTTTIKPRSSFKSFCTTSESSSENLFYSIFNSKFGEAKMISDNSEKCVIPEQPHIYLVETFYISSKKNTVFQVRLTANGLCLRKESTTSSKEQTIHLRDIIGCRCLRSKRKSLGTSACACSSLPLGSINNLKVVEETSQDLDETDVSAYLYVYAYILKKSGRQAQRERTTITLRFRSYDRYEDNNKEAQKWRMAIRKLLLEEWSSKSHGFSMDMILKDTRKVLILLNPKSGSGKARETFQRRVAQIFTEAEVPYDLHVTKYANYAREFVRLRDIFSWRYIVVVGGDGIYFEVINGIFERMDWERVIAELPIGIIPCGSGNGLARTIAHLYNEPFEPKPVLNATLSMVRGHYTPMDLVRVETRSKIMFSFLSVGWGLISDIDIESEQLRAIGYPRFTLWSIHRLINLRTYHGKLSYLPVIQNSQSNVTSNSPYEKNQIKHSMSCTTTLNCPTCLGNTAGCELCDTGFGDVLSLETNSAGDIVSNQMTTTGFDASNGVSYERRRLDSWYSANSRKSAYFSTADSIYRSMGDKLSYSDAIDGSPIVDSSLNSQPQFYGPASTIPALTASTPDTWTEEVGDFVMVHGSYLSHIGADVFFAPESTLNDAIIWLCIIRAGVSRQELLKFLLSLSSGTHIPITKNPYISMIPVSAFRIEPTGINGNFTVDGELVEHGPIQCEIFGNISKVIVPMSH